MRNQFNLFSSTITSDKFLIGSAQFSSEGLITGSRSTAWNGSLTHTVTISSTADNMRYFFNAPTLWAFDFTIQMYGAVFMMGGASAMSTKTHVKADMYYNRLSEKGQAILDLVLFICFYAPGVCINLCRIFLC